MVKGKRHVSKIYQSPGTAVMTRGPRAVMPKCPVQLEESKEEEEPTQKVVSIMKKMTTPAMLRVLMIWKKMK